jgi:glycine cleavage system transcriptional repressor
MAKRTVLTAIGDDRPGLVADVAEFVSRRGGNIDESRMLNMHGQFAIAMLVTGSDSALDAISADVAELAATTSIDVRLTPVEEHVRRDPRPLYRVEAHALDQPDLVHQVADVLRRCHANIESLETTVEPAPITGSPIFAMEILLSGGSDGMRAELERVCGELEIDWELKSL